MLLYTPRPRVTAGSAPGMLAVAWEKTKVRDKSERAEPGSPLAKPRGLKDAVGITVLVESMKLREAQNIPERMLLSSFQALSTLCENRHRDYSAAQILETTSVKSATFKKYSRVTTLGYQSCMECAERLLGLHSPALLVFYSDT